MRESDFCDDPHTTDRGGASPQRRQRLLHAHFWPVFQPVIDAFPRVALKIKVFFKYDQAGGGWSTDHTQFSTAFKCVDGTTVPITIN